MDILVVIHLLSFIKIELVVVLLRQSTKSVCKISARYFAAFSCFSSGVQRAKAGSKF